MYMLHVIHMYVSMYAYVCHFTRVIHRVKTEDYAHLQKFFLMVLNIN